MTDAMHAHASAHEHDSTTHASDHGHVHGGDAHSHGQAGHSPSGGHTHSHGPGEHGHKHSTGFKGFLYGIFVPHSHDASDSIDDALEANAEGIRAVKISLVVMLATAVIQAFIVAFSGSVALLADTIHNFSDALTAVPLWIAFALSRRAPTRRYTYGYNRAEDLAGLFIVAMITVSAIVAAWEAVDRIIRPRSIENIGWVIAAGIVGFIGNEAVAVYRIRIGQKIGSAALVADGVHARIDGFTSLAVVVGGIGVLRGFPLVDPIVGLLISAMILVLLLGTVRSVGRRLMDGIEPELLGRVEHALEHIPEVTGIQRVRLRWVGHRLHGDASIYIRDIPLTEANLVEAAALESVKRHLPNVDEMAVRTIARKATQ